jgi:RimJ/RimL family protein N-acetyltransferase
LIILESARLIFRQHQPGDLEAYCAMEMDPEVRRYVGGSPRAREDAQRRFREGALQPVFDRLSVWASILKSSGTYVGRCGLYPHFDSHGEKIPGEAAISFYLARAYWGRGLASEAAAAFVEFGWEQLRLARIVATVQTGNAASVRILEKLGFELLATEIGTRTFLKFALPNPEQRNG